MARRNMFLDRLEDSKKENKDGLNVETAGSGSSIPLHPCMLVV